MKRSLLLIPTGIVLSLGFAGVAAAHVPSHSANCDGINASGTKYDQGGTVDLIIGNAHAHHSFTGPAFSYSLGNPDKTKPESWSIVIVSNAKDGSAAYEGSIAACQQTTTTVTGSSIPAATSTTRPSTTTTRPSVSTTSTPSTSTPVSPTSTTPSTSAPSTSSAPTITGPVSSTSPSTPAASSSTTPTTPPPTSATGTPPILSQRSSGSPGLPMTCLRAESCGEEPSGTGVPAPLYGLVVGVLLVGVPWFCISRHRRLSVKS